MAAMQRVTLTLGVLVTGLAFASENANNTLEHAGIYGSWHVNHIIDRFDDAEVGRVAAVKIGEHGDLRYLCGKRFDILFFELRADDPFDKSIGRDLGLEGIVLSNEK